MLCGRSPDEEFRSGNNRSFLERNKTMKQVLAGLLILGLAAFVGCNKATGPTNKGSETASKETFTLKGPATTTSIKQGESKDVKITVDKGKAFKEDITLEFKPDTKGLTVNPTEVKYPTSDSSGSTTVKVTADKDAAVGEAHIKVKSKPTGPDLDIPIKIEKS